LSIKITLVPPRDASETGEKVKKTNDLMNTVNHEVHEEKLKNKEVRRQESEFRSL
jgi:hypothetical protein